MLSHFLRVAHLFNEKHKFVFQMFERSVAFNKILDKIRYFTVSLKFVRQNIECPTAILAYHTELPSRFHLSGLDHFLSMLLCANFQLQIYVTSVLYFTRLLLFR